MNSRLGQAESGKPAKKTNWMSDFTLWWTKSIFKKGYRNTLSPENINNVSKANRSDVLGDRLEREWEHELERHRNDVKTLKLNNSLDIAINLSKRKPSLAKALFRTFLWPNIIMSLIGIFDIIVLSNMEPIIQGRVISYFIVNKQGERTTKHEALMMGIALIICKIATVFSFNHFIKYAEIVGMRARVACCSLLYRKMLRLDKMVIDKTASGQVVNLMSNDVQRFDLFFPYIHFIWITPIQVILVFYLMWQTIGSVQLIGIIIFLGISLPVQILLMYAPKKLRSAVAKLTDRRVQFISELISGIQVIKMFAWESQFQKLVEKIRSAEIRKIKYVALVRSVFSSSSSYCQRVALYFTLVLFVLFGNQLQADSAFVIASFFSNLEIMFSVLFPMSLIVSGETSVSIKRIRDFLLLEEKDPQITGKKSPSTSDPIQLKLHRVFANWIPNQLPPTLHAISFTVEPGMICGLAGGVGSGKSAVFNLLLQELKLGAGVISIRRNKSGNDSSDIKLKTGYYVESSNIKISYCNQDPWLFNASLRDNILFGQLYDAKRYEKVIWACALQDDLKQLSYGDATIVGERGSLLSGGQKARVNLARAVYREADLYLLDDPLSAVDAKVARHLFEKCILEFLKDKTRILATHQLQFLQYVDLLVYMDRGSVEYWGSFENIRNSNNEILNIFNKQRLFEGDDGLMSSIHESESVVSEKTNITHTKSKDKIKENDDNMEHLKQSDNSTYEDDELNYTQIMSNWKLLVMYFKSGSSNFCLFAYSLIIIITQVVISTLDYWVGFWTNLEDKRLHLANASQLTSHTTSNSIFSMLNLEEDDGFLSTRNAIIIYTILVIGCIVFSVLRDVVFALMAMKSSKNLHNKTFANLLETPISFFLQNPAGRILNRFSKDFGTVDELIPNNINDTVFTFSSIFGILIVIVTTNKWMAFPVIGLLIIYYLANHLYLKTVQCIKRIEGAAKSPVLSHVNASLNGLTTIRNSDGAIPTILIKEFDYYQDKHSAAWYLIVITSAALGIFIELFNVVFTAAIMFPMIIMKPDDVLGGDIGLALSQAALLCGLTQYAMKVFSNAITQMVSISRVMEYTNLPKESPLYSPNPLPKNWPNRGEVIFQNVCVRYGPELPLALRNLNLRIEPGWKVGIVGRTGAGKSSIIATLFRLVGNGLEGNLIIDQLNTANIGLRDLRSRLSIIPQEPILFSQTLRYNVDPFTKHEDVELLDALREVELSNLSLDDQITEKGQNFSVGERQLICLARAIVRNSKILILDEATANIDNHTDSIIQNAVKKKFVKSTVLTVAHRLNTVIDSDIIVLMDKGQIVEFGSPHELLCNPYGHFCHMVDQTGTDMANKLKKQAEKCHLINIQNRESDNFNGSEVDSDIELYNSRDFYDVRL